MVMISGSGKTYAYLLPILHNILKDQSSSEVDDSEVPNSPRAIIIAPSHELIAQLEVSAHTSQYIEGSVKLRDR